MQTKFYCRHCGQKITEQDEEYQREFPVASLEAYEKLRVEHQDRECPETELNGFSGETGERYARN